MRVCKLLLAMFGEITHSPHLKKKKKQPMLLWRSEKCGFLLAVATGKEVSGVITSYCDRTDPPQLLSRSGGD